MLIVSRYHAYKSASSYAIEGMVQWLLSEDPWAIAALRRYVFYIVPMANPDGVVNGMGRLTAPQGADLIISSTAFRALDEPSPGAWLYDSPEKFTLSSYWEMGEDGTD